MPFREARTITAIGALRVAYPYAAALLCYVLVERILKHYVIDHWRDPLLRASIIPSKIGKYGGLQLSSLGGLKRKDRLDKILCKMTMRQVEEFLARDAKRRCWRDRNEIVHSNIYLREAAVLDVSQQTARNQARFTKALAHLCHALEDYQAITLVEGEGSLRSARHAPR